MDALDYLSDPPGYNTDVMDYRSLEDFSLLKDEEVDQTGINSDAEVAFRPDGTKVYVKDVDSRYDDTVQSHIAASIFMDQLNTVTPEIAYDDAFGKILMEEVPGEKLFEVTEDQNSSFHRAAAEKLLLGDIDYAGNFVGTWSYVFPVDYDSTGRDLTTAKKALDTAYEDVIDDKVLNVYASFLANQIDLEQLERELRGEPFLEETWSDSKSSYDDVEVSEDLFEGSIDQILSNVRSFK